MHFMYLLKEKDEQGNSYYETRSCACTGDLNYVFIACQKSVKEHQNPGLGCDAGLKDHFFSAVLRAILLLNLKVC